MVKIIIACLLLAGAILSAWKARRTFRQKRSREKAIRNGIARIERASKNPDEGTPRTRDEALSGQG